MYALQHHTLVGKNRTGLKMLFLRFSSRVPPRFPGHAGGAEEWETYQPEQGSRDKIHSTPPTKMMRDMRIILLWYFDWDVAGFRVHSNSPTLQPRALAAASTSTSLHLAAGAERTQNQTQLLTISTSWSYLWSLLLWQVTLISKNDSQTLYSYTHYPLSIPAWWPLHL